MEVEAVCTKREGAQPKKLARSNLGKWGGVGKEGDVCAAAHHMKAFQAHFSILNRMHAEADPPPRAFVWRFPVQATRCSRNSVLALMAHKIAVALLF